MLYNICMMDFWLRSAGCGIANAGKIIHDGLDDFGQKTGNALDSWGKQMGKDLDPSHPIHIAMTKAGEVSFSTARESLRYLDRAGQQTEKSVSEAYSQAHQHISEVDWDQLSWEVRVWIENTAKELGITASTAAKNVLYVAKSHLPEEVAQWITEHPGQTTFIVIAGAVFFAPFLIRVPVLYSLGFTTNGVAAGA
jgi:hypothetical protein